MIDLWMLLAVKRLGVVILVVVMLVVDMLVDRYIIDWNFIRISHIWVLALVKDFSTGSLWSCIISIVRAVIRIRVEIS